MTKVANNSTTQPFNDSKKMIAINIEGLSKKYKNGFSGERRVLDNLNLTDEDINIASYSVTPTIVGESVIYAAGTTIVISTKNLIVADDLFIPYPLRL